MPLVLISRTPLLFAYYLSNTVNIFINVISHYFTCFRNYNKAVFSNPRMSLEEERASVTSRDILKEIGTRFHHPFCELIIAHLIGNVIKLLHSYTVLQ